MAKHHKKLAIHVETIRNLNERETEQVAGAGGHIATWGQVTTGGFQTICPRIQCCELTVSNCT